MKLEKIKTNSILVVISLLAISLFASCDKDDKDDNDDSSQPKCQISTLNIAWEEFCEGETESGNEIISFSYDSNDRLSKWEWDDGEYLLFTYNSNGKLAKIEEHWDNDVDYLHFSWDGNKVTRQWYWGDEPSSSKRVIEFNNNDEIVRVDGYYKYVDEWVHSSYSIYTWQNSNLVKIEEYYNDDWKKSAEVDRKGKNRKGTFTKQRLREYENVVELKQINTSNDFVLGYTKTFTHDNKHNPFSIHQALGLWELGHFLFHSKNNVVSWFEVENYEGEEYTSSETFQYEYNAQNYPSKLIIEEDEDEDCNWSQIIEFNYKNCD